MSNDFQHISLDDFIRWNNDLERKKDILENKAKGIVAYTSSIATFTSNVSQSVDILSLTTQLDTTRIYRIKLLWGGNMSEDTARGDLMINLTVNDELLRSQRFETTSSPVVEAMYKPNQVDNLFNTNIIELEAQGCSWGGHADYPTTLYVEDLGYDDGIVFDNTQGPEETIFRFGNRNRRTFVIKDIDNFNSKVVAELQNK